MSSPPSAGRNTLCFRGGKHFASVVFRGFGHIHACQHPANLFYFLLFVNLFHHRGCPASRHLFGDPQMTAPETGNLRQMGNANHLMMGGQIL
jgi:hypothetical protein